MKVDPVFPVGPSVSLPRYKFVKRGGMTPVSDSLSIEAILPSKPDAETHDTGDRALLFSLGLLALIVLFV